MISEKVPFYPKCQLKLEPSLFRDAFMIVAFSLESQDHLLFFGMQQCVCWQVVYELFCLARFVVVTIY